MQLEFLEQPKPNKTATIEDRIALAKAIVSWHLYSKEENMATVFNQEAMIESAIGIFLMALGDEIPSFSIVAAGYLLLSIVTIIRQTLNGITFADNAFDSILDRTLNQEECQQKTQELHKKVNQKNSENEALLDFRTWPHKLHLCVTVATMLSGYSIAQMQSWLNVGKGVVGQTIHYFKNDYSKASAIVSEDLKEACQHQTLESFKFKVTTSIISLVNTNETTISLWRQFSLHFITDTDNKYLQVQISAKETAIAQITAFSLERFFLAHKMPCQITSVIDNTMLFYIKGSVANQYVKQFPKDGAEQIQKAIQEGIKVYKTIKKLPAILEKLDLFFISKIVELDLNDAEKPIQIQFKQNEMGCAMQKKYPESAIAFEVKAIDELIQQAYEVAYEQLMKTLGFNLPSLKTSLKTEILVRSDLTTTQVKWITTNTDIGIMQKLKKIFPSSIGQQSSKTKGMRFINTVSELKKKLNKKEPDHYSISFNQLLGQATQHKNLLKRKENSISKYSSEKNQSNLLESPFIVITTLSTHKIRSNISLNLEDKKQKFISKKKLPIIDWDKNVALVPNSPFLTIQLRNEQKIKSAKIDGQWIMGMKSTAPDTYLICPDLEDLGVPKELQKIFSQLLKDPCCRANNKIKPLTTKAQCNITIILSNKQKIKLGACKLMAEVKPSRGSKAGEARLLIFELPEKYYEILRKDPKKVNEIVENKDDNKISRAWIVGFYVPKGLHNENKPPEKCKVKLRNTKTDTNSALSIISNDKVEGIQKKQTIVHTMK